MKDLTNRELLERIDERLTGTIIVGSAWLSALTLIVLRHFGVLI